MFKFLKSTAVLLFAICLVSFLFTAYKQKDVAVCTNADEAAFGYNAYSILKTGKDEYGTTLPLRLKSFGDNKLPLYSYLSVPFVATFGLNDLGTKGLNLSVSFLLPLAVYFFTKELLGKKSYSLIAALLTATSLSTHITARQAHESLLSLVLSISMFTFYLRSLRTNHSRDKVLFLLSTALSLLSYHPARLLALFLGFVHLVVCLRTPKNNRNKMAILGGAFAVIVSLFLVTDVIYNPSRISNLLFINSPGFEMRVSEIRGEGGDRLIYNKITLGAKELLYQNLSYFSPQFLLSKGDENFRFGHPGMSIVTFLEYVFLFVGLYYLFKNKKNNRLLLLSLLFIAPLSGSLSWAGISLSRVQFLFTIIFVIAAYGLVEFVKELPKRYVALVVVSLAITQLIGLYLSWDFYLNHYSKKALAIRAQECGYSELADYIKKNYTKFNRFYITKEHGQPYMHLLYHLRFPPEKYQAQASLSKADEYGFGQVEKFDKFIFHIPNELNEEGVAYIGYPWEVSSRPGFNVASDEEKLQTIQIGSEKIFTILQR